MDISVNEILFQFFFSWILKTEEFNFDIKPMILFSLNKLIQIIFLRFETEFLDFEPF